MVNSVRRRARERRQTNRDQACLCRAGALQRWCPSPPLNALDVVGREALCVDGREGVHQHRSRCSCLICGANVFEIWAREESARGG